MSSASLAFVGKVRRAPEEHVQPAVRNTCYGRVALLRCCAEEEALDDLVLGWLDELLLAAALDIKALELGKRAVVVEGGVAFLEHLILLGAQQNHVRHIELEEDRIFRVHRVHDHLHQVPAQALAHDAAVRRVESSLVRKLEQVVEHDDLLRLVHLLNALPHHKHAIQIFLSRLVQVLAFVPAVPELAHGVHIRRVLLLADDVVLLLDLRALRLRVGLAGVVAQPLVYQRRDPQKRRGGPPGFFSGKLS
jgi:hypothetical protein